MFFYYPSPSLQNLVLLCSTDPTVRTAHPPVAKAEEERHASADVGEGRGKGADHGNGSNLQGYERGARAGWQMTGHMMRDPERWKGGKRGGLGGMTHDIERCTTRKATGKAHKGKSGTCRLISFAAAL